MKTENGLNHVMPGLLAGDRIAGSSRDTTREVESFERRPQGPIHPQGPAQTAGIGTTDLGKPALIHLMRLLRIHEDIAIAVLRSCFADSHFLMPAVHAADRIGLHRKGKVLWHPTLAPQMRDESGSALANGAGPSTWRTSHLPA